MRIAMFMPGLGSDSLGLAVHLDFVRAVEALGHSIEILTTTPKGSSGVLAASVKVIKTRPILRTLGRMAAPLLRVQDLLPTAAALASHLREAGRCIDLLHVEMAYPHGAAAAIAAQISKWNGPIVITPMGEDTLILDEAHYGFRRYPVPRRLVGWTLRRSAFIRCISPMLEERIARLAPQTPRRVVPLSVSAKAAAVADESEFQRSDRRASARLVIDADVNTNGRPLVLALGRLHPFKGIETLVRALPWVGKAMLLVVGPSLDVTSFGDTATHLLGLAKQLGVGERVRWLGPVPPERSLDMLAAADVVAVPSHLESMNKVCVEAAAVGTPFVVTKTTGISAWVSGQGVGIVVPPADPKALSRALNDILSGVWKIDLRECSAFVRPFSPRVVAGGVVDIYRSVLEAR